MPSRLCDNRQSLAVSFVAVFVRTLRLCSLSLDLSYLDPSVLSVEPIFFYHAYSFSMLSLLPSTPLYFPIVHFLFSTGPSPPSSLHCVVQTGPFSESQYYTVHPYGLPFTLWAFKLVAFYTAIAIPYSVFDTNFLPDHALNIRSIVRHSDVPT